MTDETIFIHYIITPVAIVYALCCVWVMAKIVMTAKAVSTKVLLCAMVVLLPIIGAPIALLKGGND